MKKYKSDMNFGTFIKNILPDSEELEAIAGNGMASALDKLNGIKKKISEPVKTVREDVALIKERDPAAKSSAEVLLLYSGLHAVMAYRVAHKLHTSGHTFSARVISQTARHITGIEIHPGATIGKGLFIDHGSGVVIGETAEIGDNCTLYQGVTLGGTGKHTGKRHPTLGNNVMIGAGAKVLGPFKIGDNSKVAAGAVVLDEVPEDCTAVGIPAKVVKYKNKKIEIADLDQVHIPDPIAAELARLENKLDDLEKKLGEADKKESKAVEADEIIENVGNIQDIEDIESVGIPREDISEE